MGDRELRRFGPVVVAEDVAAIDTDLARELSRFLDQMGHLLIPGTPEHGVVNALALRLPRRPRSTNYTRPPCPKWMNCHGSFRPAGCPTALDGCRLTELHLDGELTACAWLDNEHLAAVGGYAVYWFAYLPGDRSSDVIQA